MLSHTAGLGSASPQSCRDALNIRPDTFFWLVFRLDLAPVDLPLHVCVAVCPTSMAARRARCCSTRG